MKEMYREYDEKMKKAIAVLEAEYKTLRAGRANPSVLDRLSVDYYGAATPINQLASVSVTEARTLAISPYDASTLKAIEKAILASDIGINPQNDGRTIRLIFPPLTEERRKELVKVSRKYGEEAKVAVRNVRRDANDSLKKLEKDKTITEDEQKKAEADVQKLTDKFVGEVDKKCAAKEKEIMDI